MKKLFYILFICIGITHVSYAQRPALIDELVRNQVSAEIIGSTGFQEYNSGLINSATGRDIKISFGSGYGIGLRYGTMIAKKLQLSLGVSGMYSTFSEVVQNATADIYRFNFNPNLRYFLNLKNMRSRFFIGGGIMISAGGMYHLVASDGSTSINMKVKYNTAYGGNIEFGYEFFFTRRFSLDASLRYHYLQYDIKSLNVNNTNLPTNSFYQTELQGLMKPNAEAIDFIVSAKFSF